MFRPAAAFLLCAALALPPIQAEAQIPGRPAAQTVGGLATLLVLQGALDRRDARPRMRAIPVHRPHMHRPHVHRPYVHRPRAHRPYVHRPQTRHGRDDRFQRDHWPHRDARVAPPRCERTFQGQRGWRVGYGARCMWRSVDRPGLLPRVCLREVRTRHGWRQVYSRGCLARAGWRTSARD